MKITAVQMQIEENNIQSNYERVAEAITKAADAGSKLAVFPEATLSGYVYAEYTQVLKNALSPADAYIKQLHNLCKSRGICALIGYFEKEDGKLFNTVALFGAQERFQYRKIHLPRLGADRFCTPGDLGFGVFSLGGVRIGINTCYDLRFCEAARCCALQGAQLLITVTNEPVQAYRLYELLAPARAFENGMYHLWLNRMGQSGGYDFFGKSTLFDPHGEALFILEDAGQSKTFELFSDKTQKKTVFAKGEYEIDLFAHRSPKDYTRISR